MVAPQPQYFFNAFTNNFDLAAIDQTGGAPYPGGVQAWTDVIGTTQALAINNGYTADNASVPVVFSLPTTCAYGSYFRVAGINLGLWKIAQNAGQTIHFGTQNTTTGVSGYLASTSQYDTISLLCVKENTDFLVLDAPQGNITFN